MFFDVQLQFLLGGADITSSRWTEGRLHAGNVGGTRRARLDYERVVNVHRLSMMIIHKEASRDALFLAVEIAHFHKNL